MSDAAHTGEERRATIVQEADGTWTVVGHERNLPTREAAEAVLDIVRADVKIERRSFSPRPFAPWQACLRAA